MTMSASTGPRAATWKAPTRSAGMKLKPVTLPPGLEILRTRPLFTGSAIRVITMGIVALAFLAACADDVGKDHINVELHQIIGERRKPLTVSLGTPDL